ncbi:MAG: hypothetical protein M1817_006281 [Caeruleum heppii]|nr:MAG: hypothetical protein M1817_006281 [Caeruleum heppii]
MSAKMLLLGLLASTSLAASPLGLQRRQTTRPLPCSEIGLVSCGGVNQCINPGEICCPAVGAYPAGSCDVTEYCSVSAAGVPGCCPLGETCSGGGGVDVSSSTRTSIDTISSTVSSASTSTSTSSFTSTSSYTSSSSAAESTSTITYSSASTSAETHPPTLVPSVSILPITNASSVVVPTAPPATFTGAAPAGTALPRFAGAAVAAAGLLAGFMA